MTERDALLAAILAAPADDLPRLVYADWLDEHGEAAWAEYIRLSIDLRHLPWATDRDAAYRDFHPLATRRIALRSAVEGALAAAHPALTFDWRRGFVASVRGPLRALRAHLPAVIREQPVTTVSVQNRYPRHGRWSAAEPQAETGPDAVDAIGTVVHWLTKGVTTDGRLFRYNSDEDAVADLSAALLAEARAAGRPQ